MNQLVSLFFAFIFTLVTSQAFGGFYDEDDVEATRADKLLSIFNDKDASHSELELVLDSQDAAQGVKYIPAGTAAAKTYSMSELAKGAVVEEHQGIKAVILFATIDSSRGVGVFRIKYIANGLQGTYAACDVKTQRSAQGDWIMINAYTGAKVENAKIITWSLGIKTIEGICQK